MQTLNVYPTSSDFVNKWLSLVLRPVNTIFPDSVLAGTRRVSEEVVTPFCVDEVDESITLQIVDEPIVTIRGSINRSNYLMLIDHAQSVYAQGYRQIRLDLSHCTGISLSGLFALVTLCILFHGEVPADPNAGNDALRQILDKNRTLGANKNVIWQNATPKVAEVLMKNDLMLCI